MAKKKANVPKNGFTLVEIIASIVLLGIIIVAFLPIFPNMLNWSNAAEKELVESNLTGRVAEEVFEHGMLTVQEKNNLTSCNEYSPIKGYGVEQKYNKNGVEYSIKLKACKADREFERGLARVHIVVTNKATNRESDSFAFIRTTETVNENE